MWKMIALCMLSSVLLLSPVAFSELTHLDRLHAHYPYGLIGNDYGLLKEEDLAINACNAEATPFSAGKNLAYSYWQCFSLEKVKMSCETLGFDPLLKEEDGYMEIDADSSDGVHSYLARDSMKIRECQRWLKIWKKRTSGEKYVCLSGSDAGLDNGHNVQKQTHWVFDKFKTRQGCESYKSECRSRELPEKSCGLPGIKFKS
jgi:hypothetical protein